MTWAGACAGVRCSAVLAGRRGGDGKWRKRGSSETGRWRRPHFRDRFFIAQEWGCQDPLALRAPLHPGHVWSPYLIRARTRSIRAARKQTRAHARTRTHTRSLTYPQTRTHTHVHSDILTDAHPREHAYPASLASHFNGHLNPFCGSFAVSRLRIGSESAATEAGIRGETPHRGQRSGSWHAGVKEPRRELS